MWESADTRADVLQLQFIPASSGPKLSLLELGSCREGQSAFTACCEGFDI